MRRVGRQWGLPAASLSRSSALTPSPGVTARRAQGSTRDQSRTQPGADPTTGSQMTLSEVPDLTPHIQFSHNALEHVTVREIPEERRNRTDMEREKEMRRKFGEYGPGERLSRSSQQERKDMLIEQQDIDGLPWEVRWRRSMIPTSEEVIQDIRDRFDLYVQDPIEREQEWYLHWKDRSFRVQKDRMIWPQGYTDYLDHYDANGRRRTLPTEQRWTDSSWKHLADARYKERMWLIEGEERKSIRQNLQPQEVLIEEEEQRQQEMGDVWHGLSSGVVDLDPDQPYQALAASADPLEVAKTKLKIQAYGAGLALPGKKQQEALRDIDPVSGFPKSGMEKLPSGVTVEQGASIVAQANVQMEVLEQKADLARQSGRDPTVAFMKAHTQSSREFGDQPAIRAAVEQRVKEVKELQAEYDALEGHPGGLQAQTLESTLTRLEDSMVKQLSAGRGDDSQANTVHPSRQAAPHSESVAARPLEGFIDIPPCPEARDAETPRELNRIPRQMDLEEMPEWYRESLVETEPMIRSYGLLHDPLEEDIGKPEYYVPATVKEEDRVTFDDAQSGPSAFDEAKVRRTQALPELVEGFKPLPLFRDVEKEDAVPCVESPEGSQSDAATRKGAVLKKSQRVRRERQERLRKARTQYDPSYLLPTLPWEADSIVDPYRGVPDEDAIGFNKADLEATWKAYRECFQQCLTDFGNLTQVTTEAECEKMLFDAMQRIRNGSVGDHPPIPEEAEEVIRLVFEAHVKCFLSDYYRFKGNRVTEANTVKADGDEMLRRASAKTKLLGKSFMDFVQEMTALELDTVRKNPVQRYAVILQDRKYEPLAKPFLNWVKNELNEFTQASFQSSEQLEVHHDFLLRHLNDARIKVPYRVEGITDSARDAGVETFYQWCRGMLSYSAGKHAHKMYLDFAETRFRSRAEEYFENSIEQFTNYAKTNRGVVQIPIPNSDPPYEYEEKEFLDGESGVYAEVSGQLDKAESIWHSGSTKRWYPLTDETEYMWFNERRGRLSLALDISDRCLENVNKKTHPSIHPFPEKARPFLEGAPLTQETAEHLWLRYMGDLYWEHSEFMLRQGRYQTGWSYRETSLNFYHVAVRTARERLPQSWKAPLLTEAKYLLHAYDGADGARFLARVEAVVNKLFEVKEPPHWVDPSSDLPFRLALIEANISAYGQLITEEAQRRLGWSPPEELFEKNMEQRFRGGGAIPELKEYFRVVDQVAEEVFRRKVLQWRAKESEGSDRFVRWTYLYFSFRVYPKDRDEVQRLWDMYEPVYLYVFTQCAVASRSRGERLINDVLKHICQILLAGDTDHKKTLLEELKKVREKLVHLVNRKELERAITTLEAHLSDSSVEPYCYGVGLHYAYVAGAKKTLQNPSLRASFASGQYAEIRKREGELRSNAPSLSTSSIQQIQRSGLQSEEDDSNYDPNMPLSTKTVFEHD